TVFVAGSGPVVLAAAVSAYFLGASVVIMSDINRDRLAHAKSIGCEVVNSALDVPITDQIYEILGTTQVDCAIDCVGFEAKGHDTLTDEPAVVLNQVMEVTRAAGAI